MKKYFYILRKRKWLCGSFCFLLIAGCGSGTGQDETAPAADPGRIITGNVSKGPLGGAVVRVYEIDTQGQRQGPVLAQTTTDPAGNWSLSLSGAPGDLVVESAGGVYVDEADPEPEPGRRRTVQLDDDDAFAALLPADATTVAINIYTDALLRKSRQETQGANFADVYRFNRASINAAFGFDITTTQPADPIAPAAAASAEEKYYAMALGGAANAVNTLAIANQLPVASFDVISGLIDDLTDCRIDGFGVAGPVQDISTLTLSLNNQILRFRNNNYDAYLGTPVLEIDQDQCVSGQLPDGIPPRFLGVPQNLVVESADNLGIASAEQRVVSRLQDIEAVDDRDGNVAFSNDLPGILPMGDTAVTYTATDQAGNVGIATFTITVLPPEAPTIIAPPDIVARPIGALTPVNLGLPVVTDNATEPSRLVVTNDAPGAGFAVGVYRVTWTVTDEAGLSAQTLQRVNVGSEPGSGSELIVPSPPGPGFGMLPVLPDPDERPIPPIGVSEPDGVSNPNAAAFDTDRDELSDLLELVLGTDPYNPDTDGDGVADGIEIELSSDPLRASVSVRVAVTTGPADHHFSFPDTAATTPAFIIFEPGLHTGRISLAGACNHIVLIGNSQTVISSGAGRALTLTGCNDVRLYRLQFSGNTDGAVDLVDSEAMVYHSAFLWNTGSQGAAFRLVRSVLTIDNTTMQGNAVAGSGGAIWADHNSTAQMFNSILRDNYALDEVPGTVPYFIIFNAPAASRPD